MERLVYLYELDSVRNSKQEVEIGQQALFEEIVKKGNTVILSFNQLTDSEAFLCAVKNKDSYEQILELFKAGVLKVSRYGNKRTPSQYMQEAIEKCNEPNKNAFLFSGVPVLCTEHDLLEKMHWALQYSDVGILEELIEKEKNQKEKERLDYIVRFVRMILVMSMEELASNPAKSESGRSFMQFFDFVCEWLGSEIV